MSNVPELRQPPSRAGNPVQPSRTFVSPSGRQWTATAYELPHHVGIQRVVAGKPATAVLRFSCAEITLDFAPVPAEWDQLSDDDLVKLLRQATAPSFTSLDEADQTPH